MGIIKGNLDLEHYKLLLRSSFNIKGLVERLMIINKENYEEFISDEYEMSFVLGLDEEPRMVEQRYEELIRVLEKLEENKNIIAFSFKENRFEVETQRYFIYLLILHYGDVCQYTINKQTRKRANYSRRMFSEPVVNTLNKFVD